MLISKFHFLIRAQLGKQNESELRWEIYFQKLPRKSDSYTVNSPAALQSLEWTLLGIIMTRYITEHQILG